MEAVTNEELLETLEIQTIVHRESTGGAWVGGNIAGHQFAALVFPEPAANLAWEIPGSSRISKLWIKRIDDGTVVYNWDRGEDVAPRSEAAAKLVGLLAAGLADLVWHSSPSQSDSASPQEARTRRTK